MRLSRKDIFFLSVRLTLTLSLLYYLGIFLGLAFIWSYFTLNFCVMKYCFGLESVSPVDTLLVHDDDKNVANIVSKHHPPRTNHHVFILRIGAVVMEKFDTEQMIRQVYAKAEKTFRTKAKLVKIMGKYYYKKMDQDEFKVKFPKFCQVQDGIHSEDQLAQFLAKEQCIRDPYDQVQYKFIFIPNYNEKESVFVFKCHQCMADGLGLMSMLLNLQDNNQQEGQIVFGKKRNIFQQLWTQLVSPIEACIVAFKLAIMTKERNVIHSGKAPQGIKHAAFSSDYSVQKLEGIAKDNGMTMGQLVMALFGQSMKQYMVAKEDSKTQRIRVSLQCVISSNSENPCQIQLRNNLSMKIAYMDLNAEIESEIKRVKLDKNTADPGVYEAQGMHLLSKLTGLLPALISKIISLDLSKKVTLVYSKFPQFNTPMTFTGKKSRQFLILSPLLGGLNACVSVVVHTGMIKLICLSDEASIGEPRLLMKYFDQNAHSLLKKFEQTRQQTD